MLTKPTTQRVHKVLPNLGPTQLGCRPAHSRPAAAQHTRKHTRLAAAVRMILPSYEELHQQLSQAGQAHLLQHWQELSQQQQQQLVSDIKEFDFGFVNRVFTASIEAHRAGACTALPRPCQDVMRLKDATPSEREAWRQHGLEIIAQGKVAVLLLAGGQGTRLGSTLPKGCYDIGLPSHKSLFQLQAERLLRVQQLAAEQRAAAGGPAPVRPLRWLIMTSPFTHDDTLQHFKQHNFFGLKEEQITFFKQGSLPCLTEQGQVIMSSPCSIAKAPDGNGGVYMSLQGAGVLDLLEQEGVEALDTYCVDNALARLCDPLFVGYCHACNAQVGARVVARASAQEKVGVFAHKGDSTAKVVIEYSEIDPQQACAMDPATGCLVYNWANICMHYFSVPWLRQVCAQLQQGAAYHVAHKQIPSKDGPVQGIKLELFIFDTFASASRVTLMEVDRAAQFAPVKNAPGSATDSPDTARAAVLALGGSWVQAAGGTVLEADGIEVSPLVSYAGEGLEPLVNGKQLSALLVQ